MMLYVGLVAVVGGGLRRHGRHLGLGRRGRVWRHLGYGPPLYELKEQRRAALEIEVGMLAHRLVDEGRLVHVGPDWGCTGPRRPG